MLQEITLTLLYGTAIYFIAINLTYGILMLLSWPYIKNFRHETVSSKDAKDLPAVSFIIPAFNEESLIVETLQTYLSLTHAKKEIIVINDGSHDKTMTLLLNMFQLQKVEGPLYRSISYPELVVLEAPHMGKSQALNFGISKAKYDLICTMDADTIPVAHGVEACLRAFSQNKKLIAAGGIIQVLSGHVLKANSPLVMRSKEWLTSFQRLEYLRTFICERLGWSILDSTLLISGAFCMLKKEAILKVGGFNPRSVTEDFDLIVRLRRAYPGDQAHFKTLPVTTCFTQVPRTMHHLAMQRIRWQLGLVQTLRQNFSLFLHPSHGILGFVAIPYFWLIEVFSPIVELLTLILVPYALYEGLISGEGVLFFLSVGLLFNLFINFIGIYADNTYITKKKSWPIISSTFQTIFLHFGYKQINSYWRLLAIMKSFRKAGKWGVKPREEIIHQL